MTDSPHNQDTKISEDSADKSFENLLDDKQPGFLREFWYFFAIIRSGGYGQYLLAC